MARNTPCGLPEKVAPESNHAEARNTQRLARKGSSSHAEHSARADLGGGMSAGRAARRWPLVAAGESVHAKANPVKQRNNSTSDCVKSRAVAMASGAAESAEKERGTTREDAARMVRVSCKPPSVDHSNGGYATGDAPPLLPPPLVRCVAEASAGARPRHDAPAARVAAASRSR